MKNWDNKKFVLAFMGYSLAFIALFFIYFSGYFISYYKYEAFSWLAGVAMICIVFKIIVCTIANDPIIKKLPDNIIASLVFRKLENNIQFIKPTVYIISITIKLLFVALAAWTVLWKLKN